jgi:hypothetical protein
MNVGALGRTRRRQGVDGEIRVRTEDGAVPRLDVPAEHAEEHPEVEHGRVDARDVVTDETEEGAVVGGDLLQGPSGWGRGGK